LVNFGFIEGKNGESFYFPTDGAIDSTWSEGDCRCFEWGGIEVVKSFRVLLGTKGGLYLQLLWRSSK